jgi:hypothetical protein
MPKAKLWLINDVPYTKEHILERLQEIEASHQDREPIEDLDAHAFLLGFFRLHPGWHDRVGLNEEEFLYFYVARPPDRTKFKCFFVKRRTKPDVDISRHRVFQPKTKLQRVFDALGEEIAEQKTKFLTDLMGDGLPHYDPYSAQQLTWQNIDVHHRDPKTFIRLAQAWETASGVKLEELTTREDGTRELLADRGWAKSWQDYHREHADLQALTKESHRRRAWLKRDRNDGQGATA